MTKKKTSKKQETKEIKKPRKYARMFTGKSLTKQSFTNDCNITTIIRRYKSTGEVPRGRPAQYGEQGGDFQQLQFAMAEAKSDFELLPDELKEKYESIHGVLEALETTEGLAQLAQDGIIELRQPLDSLEDRTQDTEALKRSQDKNDPPPADPPEAETTT